MSPSATPATQSPAAGEVPRHHRRLRPQARHQSQPSAISATPATQNEDGYDQAPQTATQNEDGCHQAPRLPRKMKVDVTKRHTCHAKCRGVTGD